MAPEVYLGRRRWLDEPILTIEGNEVFEGRKGWFDSPILTFHKNEIYRGHRSLFSTAIAVLEGDQVFEGYRGFLSQPIAAIEEDKVYKGGWSGPFDEPIATVYEGGRMAAACGAAYLILLKDDTSSEAREYLPLLGRRSQEEDASSPPATHSPTLLVQGIVEPVVDAPEGKLIRSVSPVWISLVNHLKNDPGLAFTLSPYQWEELVAAAFDQAGYEEVVLTPRSGDLGRDVIATKRGVGGVRIIGSVKAYKPGHLVRHDDVRALMGVMSADLQASKGIITTTSDFAPGIRKDPLIQALVPYRLELVNGKGLQEWFEQLADEVIDGHAPPNSGAAPNGWRRR